MAVAPNPLQSFLWGQGGIVKTPEDVARDRQVAEALMAKGADYSPVQSWTQGLARAADGVFGGLESRWADEAQQAGMSGAKSKYIDPILAALTGGSGATPADGTPAPADIGLGVPAGPPQNTDAATIRAGLIDRGLPPPVADGFLMNFQDESGLNPAINEVNPTVPGSRGGYGLAQWTGPRRKALEAFAASTGRPVDDVNTQMDFLINELHGPEAKAAQSIMGAPDANSAAAAIATNFLRPAPANLSKRVAEYTGGAPSAAPDAPQPVAASQRPGDLIPLLLQASGDPWAEKQYGPVLGALLSQELTQRAQAADPLRQLQIQQGRADLANAPLDHQMKVAQLQAALANAPIDQKMKLAQLGLTEAKINGGVYGDSDTAAAQRIIMSGDPASKQYAIAYQQLYGPKTQQQQTPNGIVTFQIQNPPPAGVAPPTFGGGAGVVAPAQGSPAVLPPTPMAAPAMGAPPMAGPQSVAPPQMPNAPSSPVAPSGPQSSAPPFSMITPPSTALPGNIVPNTAPFNESQSRATDLARMAVPDLKTAIDNFSALTNPKDQLLQKDPTGLLNGFKDPKYQQAYTSTRAAISNILYTVSGAAIGDKELERKIDDLTPQFGDHAPVIADKLNRLANYVNSIASASKDPDTIAWAKQAASGIDAAQQSILNPLPPGVTEDDVTFTMKKYGKTREQVLERLNHAP